MKKRSKRYKEILKNAVKDKKISAKEILDLVKKLNHEPTKNAADAERAFLIALGGGCNMPIAAYAVADDKEINIEGVYASEDGSSYARGSIKGSIDDKKTLARTLALKLKAEVEKKSKETKEVISNET